MVVEKIITVNWEGPFNFKKVVDDYCLDTDDRSDFGLYQIYGPHRLYLNKKRPLVTNVLLYIGKTVSGSTFSGRIKKHGFCHLPEYDIYLGRIENSQYDQNHELWIHDVGDAEKVLINRYSPPYNANLTGDLRGDQLHSSKCTIVNMGALADMEETIRSEDVVY